jgi:predicted pyridoxine 5'-phosphate oxidase superfamily flavin-nucleotide-binding protein
MVKLTNDIKDNLAAAKFAWLATAAKDGTPNVDAALRQGDDESLVLSDQFFRKTMANLQENFKGAVPWRDDHGGFQIKDTTVHSSSPAFNAREMDEGQVAPVHPPREPY